MRYSPGDLSVELQELPDALAVDAVATVQRSAAAFEAWRFTNLVERIERLREAGQAITAIRETLARTITIETGKPITEATAEVGFVIAKIELAIADARKHLADQSEAENAKPNVVRRRPRGVAVVIGPFNFPIHLAHGAIVAYLLAGNTVIFKPSPLAMLACGAYAQAMSQAFPAGVFQIAFGGAAVGQALVADPWVRSVCFTGSVSAGRAIARACVDDLSKDVALELGGKNAAIVRADADLDSAATAIAEAACFTCGQRCNSTSRVLVDATVEAELIDRLRAKLPAFMPGDPLDPATRLGPIISAEAKQRYVNAIKTPGDWLLPGIPVEMVGGKRGHYVTPALLRVPADRPDHPLMTEELFAPIVVLTTTANDDDAVSRANATPFGLTASVFTRDADRFAWLADRLNVGNVYQNLPTTLSPGTLPFGGWGDSGNGRPGGRGFIRFTTQEQVIQCAE